MNEQYNIIILEELPLFGNGLKSLIDKSENFNVIEVSPDIYSLSRNEIRLKTDVLVIDSLHYGNLHYKSILRIKHVFPVTPVLFLVRKKSVNRLMLHTLPKVHGFVVVDNNTVIDDLKIGIKTVISGKNYYPGNINEMYLNNNKVNGDEKPLSNRELSVLKLFCGGLTYKEIANKLYISPRTVESHKNNILSKLNIRTKADMIKFAFRNDILN